MDGQDSPTTSQLAYNTINRDAEMIHSNSTRTTPCLLLSMLLDFLHFHSLTRPHLKNTHINGMNAWNICLSVMEHLIRVQFGFSQIRGSTLSLKLRDIVNKRKSVLYITVPLHYECLLLLEQLWGSLIFLLLLVLIYELALSSVDVQYHWII